MTAGWLARNTKALDGFPFDTYVVANLTESRA